MGEGNQRYPKRTTRYESGQLELMSRPKAAIEPAWDDKADARAELPQLSRTATLDDPLTTSVLAEISRRSLTLEVSAEQIDEAMELEPDDLLGAPARHAQS